MDEQYAAYRLLPFRALLESQGYLVYFDRKNKTALAQKEGRAELFVDYEKKIAYIGDEPVSFQVAIRSRRIYAEPGYFVQAGVLDS